eukprot:Opistho-2@85055
MRVWIGDNTGLVKAAQLDGDNKSVQRWSTQSRDLEVVAMCAGGKINADVSDVEGHLIVARKNGSLDVISTLTGETVRSVGGIQGQIKGLEHWDDVVMTATDAGHVAIRSLAGDGVPAIVKEFSVGPNVQRMRGNQQCRNLLAVGGKEHDVTVWDANAPEKFVFRAKNLKHDNLDLRQPIWVTDIAFAPNENGAILAAATAHRQIRLYDTRVKKRPVMEMTYGEHPISVLTFAPDGTNVLCGTAIGDMISVDIRTGRQLGSFKGFAGGIRAIECHPTLPFVASCGLDRFLRVHSLQTRKTIHKVYLKQKLNALVFSAEGFVMSEADKARRRLKKRAPAVEEIEEDDALWASMEAAAQQRKKKKIARDD